MADAEMKAGRLPVDVRPLARQELLVVERGLPYGPPEKHAERLDRQQRGLVVYLIAWHQDQPVGHGLLKWQGADEEHISSVYRGTCPDVEDLLVSEVYRSQGIGTQILQAAERLVRERGLDRIGLGVDVRNPRARALYERTGYRDAGLGLHSEHGEYLNQAGGVTTWEETCVYLVKSLSEDVSAP